MTIPQHRQFRGRFTGGAQDIVAFRAMMLKNVDFDEWDLTHDVVSRFGDHGPIHKWTFGLTAKT